MSCMKKPPINYSQIDAGVRDLVRLLNEIPFVATESSCEGHLRYFGFVFSKQPTSMRTAHGEKIFADYGYVFVTGGHVLFRCDKRYIQARVFLSDLEELAKKYDFLNIEACSYKRTKCYSVSTYTPVKPEIIADLVDEDIPFDVRKTKAKQFWQVKLAEGQKRLEEFKKVRNDLEEIAGKYARSQKP